MGEVALSRSVRDGKTIRAVIDTSCLVPFSLRVDLQQAAAFGAFTAVWSSWIIAELNRVLVWRWIKDPPPTHPPGDISFVNENRCSDSAKKMMELLLPVFAVVTPLPPYPPAWEKLTDRWDEPIWATAKIGGAQYVVSENTRHYPPRQPDGRHVHEDDRIFAWPRLPDSTHPWHRLRTRS